MAIDVCECDYRLVTELQQLVPNVDAINYNPLQCVKGTKFVLRIIEKTNCKNQWKDGFDIEN